MHCRDVILSSLPQSSALELEYEQQQRINTPNWSKWENKQFETSLGDVRLRVAEALLFTML
jgi:hypothetical protein